MEENKLIHLYIKQHTITGKKYFGKTIQDPYKYKGSGDHWKDHLKKHGKDNIITLKVFSFENQKDASEFALNFSNTNNIVKSNEWANERVENALDGSPKGYKRKPLSKECKTKMSQNRKGKPKTLQHIENARKGRLNKNYKHSFKTKEKIKIKMLENNYKSISVSDSINVYNSIRQMALALGISHTTVRNRIKKGLYHKV